MNGITAAAQGRLVADAEYRFTANGSPLLTFRLAVEEHRSDGEKGETQFIGVSVFGDRAAELNDGGRLVKGGEAYVEGRLRLASWQGQVGLQRSGLNLTAWAVQTIGSIGRKPNTTTAGGQQPRQGQGSRRGGYQGIHDGNSYRVPAGAGDLPF